jgi:cytochrome c oxidase subunit 4
MSSTTHEITEDFLREEAKKYFTFVNLAFLMTALTGIELVLIFLPFNPHLIFYSLIVLSLIKFFGVIFWFMHLIYDNIALTLFFFAGMIIATGTIIALMLLLSASDVDPEIEYLEGRVPAQVYRG